MRISVWQGSGSGARHLDTWTVNTALLGSRRDRIEEMARTVRKRRFGAPGSDLSQDAYAMVEITGDGRPYTESFMGWVPPEVSSLIDAVGRVAGGHQVY